MATVTNLSLGISDANRVALAQSSVPKFPHMSPRDAAVWRAFLATHVIDFDTVYYDVALGGKAVRMVPDGDSMKPMWKTLVAKRVDAVIVWPSEVWTIEVKPTAGMSALGQSQTYSYLWNAEKRTRQAARPVVVCSRIDDDVEEVFSALGVLVVAVSGADGSEPAAVEKILGSSSVLRPTP